MLNIQVPSTIVPGSKIAIVDEKRFWSYISPEPNSGCWLWLGRLTTNGYGRFWYDGKEPMAHRWSYYYYIGLIQHETLDHLCRVRCCVNPRHLQSVTVRVNTLRGISPAALNAKKTHCKRGHFLGKENLIAFTNNTTRQCKLCHRLRAIKSYEKNNRS